MSRYKLTGRGWALAVVFAALLFVCTYALVSLAFNGDPPEETPSGGPGLAGVTPSAEPTPPVIPPVTSEPPEEPSPVPSLEPTPTPEPTPEVTPVPPASPPPLAPSEAPPPSPVPKDPSPTPEPTLEPTPVEPSPETPGPAVPTPVQPAPSDAPPAWVADRVSVMFGFDSADMLEPEQYYADLAEFLPPVSELSGYLVVVTAYTASDETAENLAALRAETVFSMLTDLGLSDSMIRLMADPVSGGAERYRQRADISFLYVGNK